MLKTYREYDAAELSRQYETDPEHPAAIEFVRRYERESQAVRASHRSMLDVRYGDRRNERMDIYLSDSQKAPILLFIHGGYWKGGSKESRACLAPVYCKAGAHFVALEYPLTPDVTLEELVSSVRSAVAWLWSNAAAFGGDPARIHVCGNSAGGHLVGMLMAPNWTSRFGLPANAIAGGCAISGLFDLAPLNGISWLHLALEPSAIARNSPMTNLPEKAAPLIVAVGADESSEFRRQSREYAAAWVERGLPLTYVEVARTQHFSIVGEVSREGTALKAAIFLQMGLW